MRILILSCNTGEGHNMAGKALMEELNSRGHKAWMQDMMLLAGNRTSRMIGGGYVGLVKHMPGAFHLLYKAGEKVSSSKHKSPVYYANTLLAGKVENYIDRQRPDVIVTTHLFPAETLTCLRRRGRLLQKTVVLTTDYTCIPFWEETECDFYILPQKAMIEEYVQKGIVPEKLLPFGIPVSRAFTLPKEKRQARIDCGLNPEVPAYLIMSGSMGFGSINVFAELLFRQCKKGEQIVIICGHNKSMEKTLKKQFGGRSRVHVIGFTDRVSDYMDACDVIFTKPGGLSSTEAAVKKIPIVHTAPIPGCETKNLRFFKACGMSLASKKMEEQIAFGKKLVDDGEMARQMREAQEKHMPPFAASHLADFLEQLCQKQE